MGVDEENLQEVVDVEIIMDFFPITHLLRYVHTAYK